MVTTAWEELLLSKQASRFTASVHEMWVSLQLATINSVS